MKTPDFLPELPRERSQLIADLTAGLTFAVVNVPQAMGNAVLATVNPVFGLYTLMIATPIGALFTSSVFMNVSTTGALSVAAGDALISLPEAEKPAALVTLVILIGLFQILAGVLRLGSLIRFVANSVMTGFITGIALLIVLGALPDLTGYTSRFSAHMLRFADTILNVSEIDPYTFGLGLTTIALILLFDLTPLRRFSMIQALVAVTVMGVLVTQSMGITTISTVGDIAEIPRALPGVALPDLAWLPDLLLPAIAIGIIGLVQGAGVGQSYPNPDGRFPNVSRDFFGQGVANLAAGFFQGIPGGGSMSGTAVTVNAGGRSRWANIFAGVMVAAIILLLVDLVNLIPMAALGGLLVVVGLQNLQPQRIINVWQTNMVARSAMVLTLLATLVLPLQFAILIGIAITVLLHVFRSSNQIRVVEFALVEDGFPIEKPAPARLPSHAITVLHTYGQLFFASAATFEDLLPAADGSTRAAVLLLLRGQPEAGSTFLGVLSRYSAAVQAGGGRVILVGIGEELRAQLDRTGLTTVLGKENLFAEREQLGLALNEALAAARTWLAADGAA
jgi:sulfate permease, SulP family